MDNSTSDASKINGLVTKAIGVSNTEMIDRLNEEFFLLPADQKGSLITHIGLKILALMHVIERSSPRAEKMFLTYIFNTSDNSKATSETEAKVRERLGVFLKSLAVTIVQLAIRNENEGESEEENARIAINVAFHALLSLGEQTIIKGNNEPSKLLGKSLNAYVEALYSVIGEHALKELSSFVNHLSLLRAVSRTKEESEALRKEHFAEEAGSVKPTHKAPKAEQ